jgi:predicted CoA-binding protein
MGNIPDSITAFLRGRRFAVAGVSRQPGQAANAIYRKLQRSGHEVFPINPSATEVEGVRCYQDLHTIPGTIDGVIVATHPGNAVQVVRQCADRGVNQVWFHRSFGQGSVSEEAVRECKAHGIKCIVGGCPLLYCEPVDFGHRCIKGWLRLLGRLPR